MSNIQTVEIVDQIFVNVYQWSTGIFGQPIADIVFLALLGIMLAVVLPIPLSKRR